MLGLTLLRPWEAAMAFLDKDIENRSWHPPAAVRGQRIALHAGKGWDAKGAHYIASAVLGRTCTAEQLEGLLAASRSGGGQIVATVRVTDWWRKGDLLIPREVAGSRWFFGPWGWRCADRIALPEPVPCKGALGLWRLPLDVEARVLAQEIAAQPQPQESSHAR